MADVGKLRHLMRTGWVRTRHWSRCWNCSRRSHLHKNSESMNNAWMWVCRHCEVTWEQNAPVQG